MIEKDLHILVADDTPTNQIILKKGLGKVGYQITVVSDGAEAIEAAEDEDQHFDLFLLDVMMPNVDGFGAAKAIKAMARYTQTPIIFITAKLDIADKTKGFEVGAVDYIPKPFAMMEVRHRVATHLELQQKSKELADYASKMEELAEARAKQLTHADRLATLGTLSAGIAHEINNPTTFISGNAQTLKKVWPSLATVIQKEIDTSSEDLPQLSFLLEEFPNILDGMLTGVSRIKAIVDGLKFFSHQKEGKKEPFSILHAIDQALMLSANTLKRHVTVVKHVADDLPMITGNAQQIEQVLINLFMNAAHATEKRGQATLTITATIENESMSITVEDDGPGIPADALARIWDPFFTTKEVGKGTGLGLSISQNIMEEHGGSICVCNKTEGGAMFMLKLPLKNSLKSGDQP